MDNGRGYEHLNGGYEVTDANACGNNVDSQGSRQMTASHDQVFENTRQYTTENVSGNNYYTRSYDEYGSRNVNKAAVRNTSRPIDNKHSTKYSDALKQMPPKQSPPPNFVESDDFRNVIQQKNTPVERSQQHRLDYLLKIIFV